MEMYDIERKIIHATAEWILGYIRDSRSTWPHRAEAREYAQRVIDSWAESHPEVKGLSARETAARAGTLVKLIQANEDVTNR